MAILISLQPNVIDVWNFKTRSNKQSIKCQMFSALGCKNL